MSDLGSFVDGGGFLMSNVLRTDHNGQTDETGLRGVSYELEALLLGGIFLWTLLYLVLYNTNTINFLVPPGKNGTVLARVDTCDRVTAFIHACISGLGFGVYAVTHAPTSVCDPSILEDRLLRIGVALTTSYLFFDLGMIFTTDVIMKVRPIQTGMFIHHVNILILFTVTLYTHELSWFMAATLVNEVSTVCLHVTYFMAAHNKKNSPYFRGFGIALVLSFFATRIIGIGVILTMLYHQHSCRGGLYLGLTTPLVVLTWTCSIIHWLLNVFWFNKLLAMALKPGKPSEEDGALDKPEPLPVNERVPLIAQQAGLGPNVD